MCTISPSAPPPPPPPPLPSSTNSSRVAIDQTLVISNLLEFDPDQCAWALLDPELRRACIFGQVCTKQTPYHIKYTSFEPIAQIGPTCGLAALSMALSGRVMPDELLTISKSEGYSSNGEMFSCKNMAKLAEKVFNAASIEDMCVKLNSRSLFSPETVESLLKGAVLLVPYDADVNHTPTMKNGHTAHWAVVCGIILTDKPEAPYTIEKHNVHVVCRHGKSKFPCVWNLYELAQSNNNLWEFSPKKDKDGLVYILPEGGVGGKNGLRGQYLTLQWNFSNGIDNVDSDQTSLSNLLLKLDPDQCSWASSDPNLRRACIIREMCMEQPPYQIKYTKFKSTAIRYQIGPTSALVALSMVMNGRLTPDELLTISKSEGYSCNGEIFSCKVMVKLAKIAFHTASIEDMSVELNSRSLFSPETVEILLHGAILLVPYDAGDNHSPTMESGRSVHWAVVCGILLPDKPEAPDTIEQHNVHVLCRHGKSKFPCVWNLYELAQSNNNLWVAPNDDGLDYILPEGGVGGTNGLRGQYLTLQ